MVKLMPDNELRVTPPPCVVGWSGGWLGSVAWAIRRVFLKTDVFNWQFEFACSVRAHLEKRSAIAFFGRARRITKRRLPCNKGRPRASEAVP